MREISNERTTEHCDAEDEVENLYKALIARIKTRRRDIPLIARYFATLTIECGEFWHSGAAFKAVAAAL